MAFSFGGNSAMTGAGALGGAASGSNSGAGAAEPGSVNQGNDLPVIQTEGLGFLSIAAEARIQLTAKWSPPPAPTASLLSIASTKGLIAAAGPDAICIATTESVRKALAGDKAGESEVRPFTPQAKVPVPVRVSQLAFTADEQFLLISAETGGGLAIYDVQAASQGSAQPAFELSTNGETLRSLAPNPAPGTAGLIALVTNNGNLMMGNLAARTMGPVLRSQVSCVAWSTKGKQIVAGMADGSIYQVTPDGAEKGHIPKPPKLASFHVSCLSWLENNIFMAIHNETNGAGPAAYHLITRHQQAASAPSFVFQKLSDPVEPFSADKVPHHSILRLKDWAPNLQDLLMVTSTALESVGLFTRSKTALDSKVPAESVTNIFTTTELADDSKRAQLPMAEDMSEMYPVGAAVDLSSKDKVYKPIPSDEMDASPGPVPGLWLLGNEGILMAWWIIYNESIRTETAYQGLAALGGAAAPTAASPAPPPKQNALGSPGPAAPSPPAFGASSTIAPAFGGPSPFGAKSSPWSNPGMSSTPSFGSSAFGGGTAAPAPALGAPAFAQPAFGQPAAPAFGQSSMMGMGQKASPWASGSTAGAAPAFGQPSFGGSGASNGPGAPTGKVFGVGASSAPTSGGFANFAKGGGFGALATPSGTNIFASANKPASGFASAAAEVSMDAETAFPSANKPEGSVAPAFGSSPFHLGTTFKADPKTANENEAPSQIKGNNSLFGSGFGLSLNDAAKETSAVDSKDDEMDASLAMTPVDEKPKPSFGLPSTTPTTTPAPSKFGFAATAGPSSSTTPTAGGAGLFGRPWTATADTPKPRPASPLFSSISTTPRVKEEEEEEPVNLQNIPEAPLPPDPTSKKEQETPPPPAPLPPTPVSEKTPVPAAARDDALLPPDFLAKPPTQGAAEVPSLPESPGPASLSEEGEIADGEEVGSEGSGVDVAKDLSPPAGVGAHTPQSSFGGMASSTFSTISRPEPEPPRQLFGEISRNVPQFLPKKPKVPTSPRSPSPVRGSLMQPNVQRLLENPASRSVSAPGGGNNFFARKFAQPMPQQAPPAWLDPNVEQQRKLAAKREAEEQLLVDPEEEGIQQLLQAGIQPTRRIDEFIAVDVTLQNAEAEQAIPNACENLWRDIHRMIDRLGLNSRSLTSFIHGHTQLAKESSRTKDDLEQPDDWVLVEAEDVGYVIDNELARDLEDGRVKNMEVTKGVIQSLQREVGRLRAKTDDMRKMIMWHVDPEKAALARSMPLSAEQATQQAELRRAYAAFAKNLTETEEAVTLLKAKLAAVSVNGASGIGGGPGGGGAASRVAQPTVESIMRTINKMTSMAERRSGDIDVLENQMRKLRVGSAGPLDRDSPGPRGREGSPFGAPQPYNKRLSTIMSSAEQSRLRGSRDSFASSTGSLGGGSAGASPARKKMSMYTEEEKTAVRKKAAKRKATLAVLRAGLEKAGPNVARLRDDD